jgi:hypothetical protein
MTPRRFAVFIVMMLFPAIIWGFTMAGKNDLLLATRSLMGQAKKARHGTFSAFYIKYRFPEGNPSRQEVVFEKLWDVFRDCTPEKTAYGLDTKLMADDGKPHDRRQVVVQGRSEQGQPVSVTVEWIRHGGKWYIHDFSGYQAPRKSGPDRVLF